MRGNPVPEKGLPADWAVIELRRQTTSRAYFPQTADGGDEMIQRTFSERRRKRWRDDSFMRQKAGLLSGVKKMRRPSTSRRCIHGGPEWSIDVLRIAKSDQ
jgi:hypothetical protein